jgi:hypothetical protein
MEFASTPEDLLGMEAADLHDKIMQDDTVDGDDLMQAQDEHKVDGLEMQDKELDDYLSQIAQNGVDVIMRTPEKEHITPESKRANEIIAYLEQLGEGFTQVVSASPISHGTKRLRDLRVESPLLPENYEEPPGKKLKSAATEGNLVSIIDDFPLPEMDKLSDILSEEAEAELSKALAPYAQAVNDALTKERLHELDTILRVPVPSLPTDPVTVPPRQMLTNDNECGRAGLFDVFRDIDQSLIVSEKKWSGASKLDRLLPWTSFPSRLGKVQPEGDFDDGSLARYLDELDLDGKTGLEGFIWKPDGFRVLDADEDDDDELMVHDHDHGNHGQEVPEDLPAPEVANIQPPNGEVTTVATTETRPPPILRRDGIDFTEVLASRIKSLTKSAQPDPAVRSQAQEYNKSGATGLVGFLKLQGKSKLLPRQDISQIFTVKEPEKVAPQDDHTPSKDISTELPMPALDQPDRHFNVVITHTIMADWMLLRGLQSHLPNLDYVERSSRVESIIADDRMMNVSQDVEADLTISASTGIILTSLQKIKQKPLPGQEKTFHSVQERLSNIAPRYDRLIVLVGEGGAGTIQNLDERDSTALAEIMRLNGSLLPTELIVQYAPGGQVNLVHWIAALICRYGPCSDHVANDRQQQANDKRLDDDQQPNTIFDDLNHDPLQPPPSSPTNPPLLLPDETYWEKFLRAAGMNAFAAQMVLGHLKRKAEAASLLHNSENENSNKSPNTKKRSETKGLAAFIRMPPAERQKEFGEIFFSSSSMGERGNLLAKVGRVLDGSGRREEKGGYWCAVPGGGI